MEPLMMVESKTLYERQWPHSSRKRGSHLKMFSVRVAQGGLVERSSGVRMRRATRG